jgi:hypothetical protein
VKLNALVPNVGIYDALSLYLQRIVLRQVDKIFLSFISELLREKSSKSLQFSYFIIMLYDLI